LANLAALAACSLRAAFSPPDIGSGLPWLIDFLTRPSLRPTMFRKRPGTEANRRQAERRAAWRAVSARVMALVRAETRRRWRQGALSADRGRRSDLQADGGERGDRPLQKAADVDGPH
jgi:hypothetical protein